MTPPCCLTISQSESCAPADHTPCDPPYLLTWLLKVLCMPSCFSCVQLFATLWTVPSRLLCLWDSPDKNTGVGCHALLQGIFPTQELNLRLLHLSSIRFFIAEPPLKVLCRNALGNSELFRSGATHFIPLQGPAVNLSLLQTPSFQVV